MRSCSTRRARTRACTATGQASLWLSLTLAALALAPASAGATATLTEFTVTPASTQAGSHPDVTIFQRVSLSTATDDVDDTFVRLAPGLLGNPQAASLCSRAQLRSSPGCPASARVGSVRVIATIHLLPPLASLPDQAIDGTVYNLRPVGGEPARLGLKLQPLALPAPLPSALPPVYLESPVYLRPGPDGIGLESIFADQPRTQSGLNVQITSVRLTFRGRASRGSFMRMPTSCGPGTSLARVNSWDAPSVFSTRTWSFSPTGCDSLGFAPTASGSLGAPGATRPRSRPPVSTTLHFDPEQAALEVAEVTLPPSIGPNVAVLGRACPRAQADANQCPASSRVGTATIVSPLQATPVSGPVYLAFNTDASLPGLIIKLPPPVDLRVDGVIEATPTGLRNTFAGNPDLPLRSFKLEFEGGANGPLELSKDLCDPKTSLKMDVNLTAHSGKTRRFEQELATPGCDPLAKADVVRKRRGFRLTALLRAARRGPDITRASVKLPKGLKRGRLRPRVVVDGDRLEPGRAGRAVKPKLGDGARRIRITWSGLKRAKGKQLPRRVVIPVTIWDARGKQATLRLRVLRG
jgi:hypothetical protein